MDSTCRRLKKCFAAVFPDIPQDQIEAASLKTVKAWDSIAMVTLISVVEEEFGRPIVLEEIPNLNSFDDLRRYLISQDGVRP